LEAHPQVIAFLWAIINRRLDNPVNDHQQYRKSGYKGEKNNSFYRQQV
jgi:hypothetical protein